MSGNQRESEKEMEEKDNTVDGCCGRVCVEFIGKTLFNLCVCLRDKWRIPTEKERCVSPKTFFEIASKKR